VKKLNLALGMRY